MQNPTLQIMSWRITAQFFLQHSMEDLQRSRSINKRASWLRRHPPTNRRCVTVARLCFMQEKLWLEARIKIQQLPNSYLRFPRVTSPTRDRIGYAFIEAQQPIFRRSQRSQIPEGLRPAINLVRHFRALFQPRPPILDCEQRNAAMPLGIVRRHSYGGCVERSICASRTRKEKQQGHA